MANGKYREAGPANTNARKMAPRAAHSANPLDRAAHNFEGVSRDAVGMSSLLGTSIPKGPLSPALGAQHGSDANTLVNDQGFAGLDIATVLAQIQAVSTSRSLRAAARNAEAQTNSSTPLSLDSPRLMAFGRGPAVTVMGMTPGDLKRVVNMFERYGYTINQAFTPQRLDVMTHYSYWKTNGAVVLGDVPQAKRQTIAGAFDAGVTIWDNIAEIGTDVTDANTPHSGISY